jgi:hypothetical protein
MKESDNVTSSQMFLILILVFSLISGCILNANTTTGIDAFAKKILKHHLLIEQAAVVVEIKPAIPLAI